jgi:hypothetical protein
VRHVSRRFKRHFGATSRRVAIRSQRPWFWRPLLACVLVFFGYLIAYWQLAGGEFGNLRGSLERMIEENRALQAKLVHGERQMQVERAAQDNLTLELAKLQDEGMRLKEDIEFYRNILNETPGPSEVKIQSFRLAKGKLAGEYEYHLMIVQSGRSNKTIQGNVKLTLLGIQDGQPVSIPVNLDAAASQAMKINFKYYQRLDGGFSVPQGMNAEAVEASFIEIGASQPKISQKVDLPA